MKTFETPKIAELGTLQQIVLSSPTRNLNSDPATGVHASNGTSGS